MCPKLGAGQVQNKDSLIIKEDIVACYYKWEIFAIEKRVVKNEIERLKIHNRMMWVLTGDSQYQKESQLASARMTN